MRIAFEYFIYTYGPTLALTIIAAIFGTFGYAAKRLWNKYINTKEKESIAIKAAEYVEQVWRDIHGAEKLKKALETAETMLKKKGISFDAEEMEVLIEAALAEFNDAFHKPISDGATADATRRAVCDDGNREDSGLLDE